MKELKLKLFSYLMTRDFFLIAVYFASVRYFMSEGIFLTPKMYLCFSFVTTVSVCAELVLTIVSGSKVPGKLFFLFKLDLK